VMVTVGAGVAAGVVGEQAANPSANRKNRLRRCILSSRNDYE
jgi:hypothetical protein